MFESYFQDVVTRITRTFDKWGSPTGETTTQLRCRVETQRKLITNTQGQMVISPMQIIVNDSDGEAISFGDRIRIDNEDHQILNKVREKDFSPRGWRLYLA